MSAERDLSGRTFGRWTVLDSFTRSPKGERKWQCRCQCGTERYVLERSLLSGGSLSCGCLRRDNAASVNSQDLTGRVFGELTVLGRAGQRKSGGIWWLCRCSCGQEYQAPATLLLTGRRTHCSSKAHARNYAYADIAGRRFHRLVALYPTGQRGDRGSVVWHCRCDCGQEVDISYNSLMYSEVKSCGCQKREHDRRLREYLTYMDGTSLEMIRSKKVPSNSTTGTRGVYLIRGRYVAKITFQKRTFTLGTFGRMDEAIAARQKAERVLFDFVADYYERYRQRAAADAHWAEDNQPRVLVTQDENKELSVTVWPELSAIEP